MPREEHSHDRGFVYLAALAIIVLGIVAFSAREASVSSIVNAGSIGTSISVGATGIAYDTPSQATIYLTANATGNTTASATDNLTATLNSLNSTLSGYINGNTTYVTTSGYQSYKIYNRTGYQVTENLQVVIPDIANVSSAIGAVSQVPHVYFNNVQPSLSPQQLSSMREVAISRAMQNATQQAEVIAPNTRLRITNVSVGAYTVIPPVYYGNFAAGASASKQVPYYGGRSSLVESVSVVFSTRACGC